MVRESRLSHYQALLLRMWLDNPGHSPPGWRLGLEDVQTGERNGFAELDALVAQLRAQLAGRAAARALGEAGD